jgi:hypothetical protein
MRHFVASLVIQTPSALFRHSKIFSTKIASIKPSTIINNNNNNNNKEVCCRVSFQQSTIKSRHSC